MAFVEFENVGKTYHMGEVEIHALHDTTFQVEKGELVVIVDKAEYSKLMSYIFATDRDAFVTVYAVQEIIYRPKPLAAEKTVQ